MTRFINVCIAIVTLSALLAPAGALSGDLTPRDLNGVENAFDREVLGGYEGEPPEVRYFYESNERPPKFEGEVAVLFQDPLNPYVALGRVWLLRQADRDTLLAQMKEVAAWHGANAVILYTADPVERSRDRLLWKGKAVLIE